MAPPQGLILAGAGTAGHVVAPRPLASLAAGLRIALVPYLVSRVFFVAVAWIANLVLPYARYWDPQHPAAVEGLLGWDGLHYMAVARAGYPAGSGQFNQSMFPLLPLLLRATGASDAAGVALALVLGLAGIGVMAGLTRAVWDDGVAGRTAWVAAFWPTGLIWSAVYSEGLFVALTAGCLWAAWRNRPVLAAALGFGAGLTRFSGAALLLPLAVLLPAGRARLAAAAPVAGLATFAAYLGFLTGDPLAVLRSETGHGHVALFQPWQGVISAAHQLHHVMPDLGAQLVLAPVILALIGGLFTLDRWRAPALALAAGLMGLPLLSGTLSSFARYAMVVFPIYWIAQRAPSWLLWAIGLPVAAAVTTWMATARMTP